MWCRGHVYVDLDLGNPVDVVMFCCNTTRLLGRFEFFVYVSLSAKELNAKAHLQLEISTSCSLSPVHPCFFGKVIA